MKLHAWMKISGMKQARLARLAGISNQRVTRILRHGLIPHPDEMVSFYWITLGAVRPEDFYDLGTCPADLKVILPPLPLLHANQKEPS